MSRDPKPKLARICAARSWHCWLRSLACPFRAHFAFVQQVFDDTGVGCYTQCQIMVWTPSDQTGGNSSSWQEPPSRANGQPVAARPARCARSHGLSVSSLRFGRRLLITGEHSMPWQRAPAPALLGLKTQIWAASDSCNVKTLTSAPRKSIPLRETRF